jgi:hypothetical protein
MLASRELELSLHLVSVITCFAPEKASYTSLCTVEELIIEVLICEQWTAVEKILDYYRERLASFDNPFD